MSHPTDIEIGRRIRQRREALGVTQAALAQGIGVTFQQVQKYEKGTNRVAASRLGLVAQVLDCRAADLLEGATPVLESDDPIAFMAETRSGRAFAACWREMPDTARTSLLNIARAVVGAGAAEPEVTQ